MSGEMIDPMVERINWITDRLSPKRKTDLKLWIEQHFRSFNQPPSMSVLMNYVINSYHWQIMNTLIYDFGLQEYEGKYIFSYASWNYDKPVTQVYLEHEFRRYLRLFWNGKIGVIPCRES